MQSDITVVSIASVQSFLIAAVIIIATHGKKNITLTVK